MNQDGIGPLIYAGTNLIPMHPEEEEIVEEGKSQDWMLIGAGVAGGIAIIAGIVILVWLKSRSNKVEVDNSIPVESNSIMVESQSPDKTM